MTAFTVHRETFRANQQGLVRYLLQQGKAHLAPDILAMATPLLARPGDRLPLDEASALYQQVAELLDERFLGIDVIRCLPLAEIPLVSTLQRALAQSGIDRPSPDLLLTLLVRHFRVITEVLTLEPRRVEGGVLVIFHPCDPNMLGLHHMEGAITGVLRLISAFCDMRPLRCTLTHTREKQDKSYLEQAWGVPVEFAAERYSLLLGAALPDTMAAQHRVAPLLGPLHHLMTREFPGQSVTERCENLLNTCLGVTSPTREIVAALMNMSVSSLQRRLREEGTSFKDLLDEVRKVRARQLMAEQSVTTSEAAFLLSYQSAGQFFKAFRRWYGITPAEMRTALLSAGP